MKLGTYKDRAFVAKWNTQYFTLDQLREFERAKQWHIPRHIDRHRYSRVLSTHKGYHVIAASGSIYWRHWITEQWTEAK